MNITLIISGFITLFFSLGIGIVSLWIGFKLYSKLTSKIDEEKELKERNIAVAILVAAFIFSLGYILKSSIDPMTSTFYKLISGRYTGSFLLNIGAMFLQFSIALLMGIFSLWLGLQCFTVLNHNIKEWEEIKAGNIAVSLVTAAVLVTLALFIAPGLEKLLQSIVIAPQVLNTTITPLG